jgi:alpha-beta hydrolase superfamily lysophospholipase
LTEDPTRTATGTFPLLEKAIGINLRIFVGMQDQYATANSAEAEYNKLRELGSTKVELVKFDTATHEAMSSAPWKEGDYMQWAVDRAADRAA